MDGSHNPHQHSPFDERVRERERRAGDTRDGIVRALPGTSPDDVVYCGPCANDDHERCRRAPDRRCDCAHCRPGGLE